MRNKLTLRTRMAVWFTLSVLAVTSLFFGVLYFTVHAQLMRTLQDDLSTSLVQLSSQVEMKGGQLIFEDETPVKSGIMYYITEENGSEIASHGEDITLFDALPVKEGSFTSAYAGNEHWLLLDSEPLTVNDETMRIRVVVSCVQIEQTLSLFKLIFALGVPLLTALAALIGFLLAKRSLQPIHQIIACADDIAQGDFSRRIPEMSSSDELGEMTRTLNRMLASQEDFLRRERRFTSDASHELRTPVAVIQSCAESLENLQAFSEEDHAKVRTILDECRRMQKMIEQLLTLSRGQEGRYPVTMESISLNEIFDGVQSVLEPMAQEQAIRLHFDIASEIIFTADQSLLTQLLLNLIGNAVKYGKEGGDVWVHAERQENSILLTVEDNGIGIAGEQLPHIFERFFRADAARDRTGTGLGLAIVQWIVDLHGGNISVTSEINVGTKFTVHLPSIPPSLKSN
jgi:signal transduction histidine kinase